MRFETIWLDARLATLAHGRHGLGIVERGAVAAKNGRIAFAGPMAELPTGWDAIERVALDGRWITPGLIDCHTHLVYAGDRSREFELRLSGASYEDIARAGGGIVSTVTATRAASEDDLVARTCLASTVCSPKASPPSKSSRGTASIAKPKRACSARRAGSPRERNVEVITSFLGAHALPPEANGDKERYIDEVCAMISGHRSRQACRCGRCVLREYRVLARADVARVRRRAGGGTAGQAPRRPALQPARRKLAAEHGALSADHLEYTDEDGVAAMARAGTVAVLLPGAFYVLREKQVPPIDAFRRHGVPMAIATDCNPGTSPLTSLLLT